MFDIPIPEAHVPPHDDRTWVWTHATLGQIRASQSVRLGSRMIVINDFMKRVMEMEMETQEQLKEIQINTSQQIREMRVDQLARS